MSTGRAAARLDAFVADRRATLAVVVPLGGAATLLSSEAGLLPPSVAYHPAALLVGTLVLRLPLAAGLAPVVGRRAALSLLGLAAYAYAVEYVGLTTGLPYGSFRYAVDLGPMVAGVPLGLPVFFVPLVVNAYLLSVLLTSGRAGRVGRVTLAVGVLLLIDAVLDPAAVAVGFWTYAAPGAYYGVPLSNFGGWILSGLVGILALEAGFDRPTLSDRLASCPYLLDDFVSFTLLWGVVNARYGHWIPVLATGALVVALVSVDRFDVAWRLGGTPSGEGHGR